VRLPTPASRALAAAVVALGLAAAGGAAPDRAHAGAAADLAPLRGERRAQEIVASMAP
jgi:hypothetical protein